MLKKNCLNFRILRRNNFTTHEVINQSRPFVNFNSYQSDPAIQRALSMQFTDRKVVDRDVLIHAGAMTGSSFMINHAESAEKNGPLLKQFDIYGHRVDTIEYHPSYHILMKEGIGIGASAYGYNNYDRGPGSHVIRAALIYMQNQLEPGHCCPLVMTSAAVPVLRRYAATSHFAEKLCIQEYDSRDVPISEKAGITMGMSMTEKQVANKTN